MSKLSLHMKRNVFSSTTARAPFYIRNMLYALKSPLASSVDSVSKQIVLSKFSPGVNIQSSLVWSLSVIMLHADLSWKPSAKVLWQVF